MPNMPLVQRLAMLQATGAQQGDSGRDNKERMDIEKQIAATEKAIAAIGKEEDNYAELHHVQNIPDSHFVNIRARKDSLQVVLDSLIGNLNKFGGGQTGTPPDTGMAQTPSPSDSMPWEEQVHRMKAMLDSTYGVGTDTMSPDSIPSGSEDEEIFFLKRFLNYRLGLNLE